MNLGYRVLSACDGEEALRLCEKEAPALAILDVVMPKLGGTAAASKLAASFTDLPILYTSGYSQDSANVAPASANSHYLVPQSSAGWCGKSSTTRTSEKDRTEADTRNRPGHGKRLLTTPRLTKVRIFPDRFVYFFCR
jgi:CheY-like chemotaxis protein